MTRYREIEVAGPPRELGRQIGEAARDEVRGFCAVALERVNKNVRISRDRAMKIATRCIEQAEAYSPDMVEELRGTAEAAGVTLDDLMLLQVRNQYRPEGEAGCTALSSGPVVAQNWDNDPALDPFTVVLTRRPEGKPALMTVTQAGLISYLGFNEKGIGACVNTLPAPSREVGVPHYFTLRGIYEADSLEGAAEAVRRAQQRAIPANIMLATPQGPADLEVTIDDVHILRPEVPGAISHSNHCIHPDLVHLSEALPELIQSKARRNRIEKLLVGCDRSPGLEDVKSMLRDHDDHPRSICRHPNDHPETGFWCTVFSVIIEATAGRMHVSRGTPCDRPYETYRLN